MFSVGVEAPGKVVCAELKDIGGITFKYESIEGLCSGLSLRDQSVSKLQ